MNRKIIIMCIAFVALLMSGCPRNGAAHVSAERAQLLSDALTGAIEQRLTADSMTGLTSGYILCRLTDGR